MFARKVFAAALTLLASASAHSGNGVVIIEMYGDSTTLGTQAGTPTLTTSKNEPNQLQDLLQSEFGKRVIVINNGVGGAQAYQLLKGEDGRNRPWNDQMKSSAADFVILNYGLNDQYYGTNPTPGHYSATPESYADIIGWLTQAARDNGKGVILQEPNPTCYQPAVGNLQKFVDALRREAKLMNAPLVPQYDYIQSIPEWKSMLSDCEHPGDKLYGIKAQQTFNVLAPIVRARLSERNSVRSDHAH